MNSRVLIVAALLLLTTPVDGAGPLADAVKSPPECAAAKNANECADLLKKLGKNPFDAFGYIGREPAYGGQNEAAAPPCKSGAPSCNPWERDWSNTRLPPGAIVTDEGAILPQPSRPFPWNYLFDWQTLIAGVLAFVAGFGTVVATMIIARRQIAAAREDADKVIVATREQTETTVRLERERVLSEVGVLRAALAVELRLQIVRALAAYEGLYGLGFMPNAPITARMVESKSRMAAPIIYPANAGKIGLLGAEAMDVVIVYDLLETARDGAARLMNFRSPDDIAPAVVVGTADAFLAACIYARGVLPKFQTGDPSHDAKDEALIQKINDNLAARRK